MLVSDLIINTLSLFLRYVHSMNRAGLSFSLSVNHLADRSEAELAVMRGSKGRRTHRKAQPFPSDIRSVAVPDSVDWRLYGAFRAAFRRFICLCFMIC